VTVEKGDKQSPVHERAGIRGALQEAGQERQAFHPRARGRLRRTGQLARPGAIARTGSASSVHEKLHSGGDEESERSANPGAGDDPLEHPTDSEAAERAGENVHARASERDVVSLTSFAEQASAQAGDADGAGRNGSDEPANKPAHEAEREGREHFPCSQELMKIWFRSRVGGWLRPPENETRRTLDVLSTLPDHPIARR
jgi:hypothetical protein